MEEFAINNLQEELILLPRFAAVNARHICKYLHKAILNKNISRDSKFNISPLYIRKPDAKPPKKLWSTSIQKDNNHV